ncbi:hypothetical protein F4553_003039 [Allocatelliglobosispora scoriae]|uniref:Uncharacterized protein n=1 Tax=Allocatelliglobosispora scoriae TaxID=643052 RepID=A0A841BS86_9ACTN|nr:hypothetical protein [Allocatelliglobosispora scoriae]MBB5869660.1 hypothetical protein [Allocatelliglobosispora scoriae]
MTSTLPSGRSVEVAAGDAGRHARDERVTGGLHEDAARPDAGVLRVPFGGGTDEAGVERVDVVLALPHRPAGVVHAHEAAAAADVGLERGTLGGVEQDTTGLDEDHGVADGEVRGVERGRVVGLLDVDRLAVLRAELGGEVAHGLPSLHVGGVEVGLVEEQHAEPAVVVRCGVGHRGGHRSGDQQQRDERCGGPAEHASRRATGAALVRRRRQP